MEKIYLRNQAEIICDIFENWLANKDYTIPNEERKEYCDENNEEPARMFGSNYYEIEDIATDELNLFVTGQYPNGLLEVVEDEISAQKGAEVIVSHFTALLNYHGLPYKETDEKELIETITAIFDSLDKKVKESDEKVEFEIDYC